MKKIVILGGGYAGVHAGKILHKAFKKNDNQTGKEASNVMKSNTEISI